ncbi:MAG TPA: hypothetical protein VJZ01_13565 [Lachnospiraceae bacterium]|jgi:hypothetical protein|nr:hypothetical protein [Lachnospiraceae bacterium]
MAEREELIQALYQSFKGTENLKDNKDASSVYNASTGTLYCTLDKKELSKLQIEQAESYMLKAYEEYNKNPFHADKAVFYRIALEAIRLMTAKKEDEK